MRASKSTVSVCACRRRAGNGSNAWPTAMAGRPATPARAWLRRDSGERSSPSSIPGLAGGAAGLHPRSSLAVWEVILLLRSYKSDAAAVARHLRWPQAKVQAPQLCGGVSARDRCGAGGNEATDYPALRRMLPQAAEFCSCQEGQNLTCSDCCLTSISRRMWRWPAPPQPRNSRSFDGGVGGWELLGQADAACRVRPPLRN